MDIFVFQGRAYCAALDGGILFFSLTSDSNTAQEIPVGDWKFRYVAANQNGIYAYDKIRCSICAYVPDDSTWKPIQEQVYMDGFAATVSGVYFISNETMTLCQILPDIVQVEDTGIGAKLLYSNGERLYYCNQNNIVYSYDGHTGIKENEISSDNVKDVAVSNGMLVWSESDGENLSVFAAEIKE